MDIDLKQRPAIVSAACHLYRNAPTSARVLQTLRPYICPFEDLLRWVPDSGYVLDVGCGAGLFLGLVGQAHPRIRAIGFDADASAIKAAKIMSQANYSDGRIAFECSAVGDGWPAGQFDVVSMIDVLHHIPPSGQQAAIAESFAHVRPGGVLIYKDMADRPFFRAWWNRIHDMTIARQWIHYRPVGQVEGWLRGMGAQILERSSRSIGFYGHEWIVAQMQA